MSGCGNKRCAVLRCRFSGLSNYLVTSVKCLFRVLITHQEWLKQNTFEAKYVTSATSGEKYLICLFAPACCAVRGTPF